jgi:SAM-dependent methyltransferase
MSTFPIPGPSGPFSRYAAWYDAFNHSKAYAEEIDYVLERIAPFTSPPQRWLDIGCGTGRHLRCVRNRGIQAEGIDVSDEMVRRARLADPEAVIRLGRLQDVQLPERYDVVSMLFHVIDYLTEDEDVEATLTTAARHLNTNGVLVFDFWNTKAVRRDPPCRRVRQAFVDGRALFRIATPREDSRADRIDVHYEFHWDAPDGPLEHAETHSLRHYAETDLARLLEASGLRLLSSESWMQRRPLTDAEWYGFVCAGRESDRR